MAPGNIAPEKMAPGRNGTIEIWEKKWHPKQMLLLIGISLLVVGEVLLTKTIHKWISQGAASHILGLTTILKPFVSRHLL